MSNVHTLRLCLFLDLVAVGAITPILPLLVGEFTVDAGKQALWFGLISTMFGVAQLAFAPVAGGWSERVGKKVVLLVALAGAGSCYFLASFAPNLTILAITRLLAGVFAASQFLLNAYMADYAETSERAAELGKLSAVGTLGYLTGVLAGGLVGDIFLALPFLLSGAITAVNFGIVALRLPNAMLQANLQPKSRGFPIWRLNGGIYLFAAALALSSGLLVQTAWVLHAHDTIGWTAGQIGVALFFVGIGGAALQAIGIGPLIRLMGEPALLIIALGFGLAACVFYANSNEPSIMIAGMIVSLPSFMTVPLLQSLALGSSKDSGRVMASFQAIRSLALVFVPTIAGVLMSISLRLDATQPMGYVVFALAALLQLIAIAVLSVNLHSGRRYW